MASTSAPLLEREREVARVLGALEDAAGGAGRLVVVEGAAGIGKTSVLAAARKAAEERGLHVLTADGGEFERELGFGVVRQLFESALRAAGPAERRALLAGAAGLAGPLLLPTADSGAAPTADPAALLHGLYWLAANLAERRPLVLSVDDAQWCDLPSLAWLLYLARRLDDLAVLVIVAVRSGAARAQGGALAAIADSELAERVELAPLSEAGSAQVVRAFVAQPADDELCRACFDLTGGNPFLLRELMRALGDQTAAGGARSVLVDRIRALTPRAVSRSVIARLSGLSGEAADVARALAVLGGRAEPRELLGVAGVEQAQGLTAIDELEREQIAGGRPVRFVHPLVGSVIYSELGAAEGALEHARAARVLARMDAGAGRVAGHVMLAEPAADPWAVQILREAARAALRDGTPEAAVPLLARALAEPPPAGERALVLHELGVAELLAGRAGHDSASHAEGHLADAVAGIVEPRAKAQAALDWGDALWARHRYADAVGAFDLGIASVAAIDSELALRIEAHAVAAARLDLGTCDIASERLRRFDTAPPQTPAGRLIAGVLAIDRALAGEPVEDVVALAERMLEDGHLPSGHVGAQIPLFAINALLWSDEYGRARSLLDEMIAAARAGGSTRGLMIALCWRGEVARRCGDLAEAAGDLATAVELAGGHGQGGAGATHALLAEVLVERGDIDGATRALEAVPLRSELPDYIGWNYVLHAHGMLHAARLEFREALERFLACGARQARWGADNPSVMPWRSHAALAQLALGDHGRARELANEELALAQRFGAPRAIGIALRALGLVERGERQTTLLREAVAVLAGSPARLDRAHALSDLGGALRRANERAAAREPLREALELAVRCGAAALSAHARAELLATGARPRRALRSGPEALTPVERQAASLAAQGLSNPQIAQALFISRKTVEKRLSEAYRKLAIGSRDELASALAGPSA